MNDELGNPQRVFDQGIRFLSGAARGLPVRSASTFLPHWSHALVNSQHSQDTGEQPNHARKPCRERSNIITISNKDSFKLEKVGSGVVPTRIRGKPAGVSKGPGQAPYR